MFGILPWKLFQIIKKNHHYILAKYFKQCSSYCNYNITILKHFCWPLSWLFFVGSLQQIFWDKVRKDQCWNMQVFCRKIENKNLASCFLFYTWTSCRQVSIHIICFSMMKNIYWSLQITWLDATTVVLWGIHGCGRMVVDLQLPMQSVHITTKVVSSNHVDGEVYLIQH